MGFKFDVNTPISEETPLYIERENEKGEKITYKVTDVDAILLDREIFSAEAAQKLFDIVFNEARAKYIDNNESLNDYEKDVLEDRLSDECDGYYLNETFRRTLDRFGDKWNKALEEIGERPIRVINESAVELDVFIDKADIDEAYELIENDDYMDPSADGVHKLVLNHLDKYVAAGLDPVKALKTAMRNPGEFAYLIVHEIYPKCSELSDDDKKEFFEWWKDQLLSHVDANLPTHVEEILENGEAYGFRLKDCGEELKNKLVKFGDKLKHEVGLIRVINESLDVLGVDKAYELIENDDYDYYVGGGVNDVLDHFDEYIIAGIDPVKALKTAMRNMGEYAFEIVHEIYPKCPELSDDDKKEFFEWWKDQLLSHADADADLPFVNVEKILENGKEYGFRLKDCSEEFKNKLVKFAIEMRSSLLITLYNEGASFLCHDEKSGDTPLIELAKSDPYLSMWSKERFKPSLAVLISKGAYINDRNNKGQTPVMCAALLGYSDNLQALLEYQPDLTIRDRDNKNVMDYAIEVGNKKCVGMLYYAGARPSFYGEKRLETDFNITDATQSKQRSNEIGGAAKTREKADTGLSL